MASHIFGTGQSPPSIFPLQARGGFGTFSDVRMLAVLMTLLTGVCTAVAQKQETRLIDRLLRPNAALVNSAQDKEFAVPAGDSFAKRVPAPSFYSRQKPLTKNFPGERTLTPQQFAGRHFRMGDSVARLATRTDPARNDKRVHTRPAPGIRVAQESTATVTVREFPGTRPFLGRGKSQNALQAYNRPLTIDEVRELLNKSK